MSKKEIIKQIIEVTGCTKEKAEVIFSPRGSRLFADWPEETRYLLKPIFGKHYELYPDGSGWGFAPLRRDPNYPERIIFATSGGSPRGDIFRVFISLDNGNQWAEVSSPRGAGEDRGWRIFAVAIKSTEDNIVLYVGLLLGGENIVQYAVLPLPKLQELQELIAKK